MHRSFEKRINVSGNLKQRIARKPKQYWIVIFFNPSVGSKRLIYRRDFPAYIKCVGKWTEVGGKKSIKFGS